VNQTTNNNWIDAWLETQAGWLDRWQSVAVEQRAEAMRRSMDAMREQCSAAGLSSAALSGVMNFQSLLQSCMPDAAAEQHPAFWQQLLQAFPLGPMREQQAAWQEYMQAHSTYQSCMQVVLQAFGKVLAQSLAALPAMIQARAAQRTPVNTLRELYDLWIDCGEQAFAALATDNGFVTAQAASGNSLSRLKNAQNVLIEHWLKSHDLPTRSELNSVHLRLRSLTARITQLENQLAESKPVIKTTRGKPRKSSKE
jgi:class III poly(R)-hydroxyalkanoic acid synthase PhaE subunit